MNILVGTAELAPFAKVGGLADAVAALARQWSLLGHRVLVVLPKYRAIDVAAHGLRPTEHIVGVPLGWWTEYARLWLGVLPQSTARVCFLENADYYDREGIYGNPEGYADNDRRFIFLSRALFEVASALGFSPDVIHAHDYHTALAMPLLKLVYRWQPRFYKTAGVLTIHNIAFQGLSEPSRVLPLLGIPWEEFYPGSPWEYFGSVNMLKVGILYADKISTVSPSYAWEIRTTPLGEGLQGVLNFRGADLVGILNGVDYAEWDPGHDRHIYVPYSAEFLAGKQLNKRRLLNEWAGMSEPELHREVPLLGMVSRLTDQKGIDLLCHSLEGILAHFGVRFALLGSGANRYEDFFRYLASRYSRQVFVQFGYNEALAHKIIAAADYLLMPSRYEPCGLTQMYALRYGTIPIVRAVGGLRDTVRQYDPATGEGWGFLFGDYTPEALWGAVEYALGFYRVEPHWERMRRNAMACDFSTRRSAEQYLQLFEWALERVRAERA
ncbi:MAG: glycogen synthase [Candidatus Kapabacteria bacterium]|nr:glycogen synthase [Candidatus Kapabacteria bacterium]MDW8012222.1 glycogen synthase [Bacteroidota bacterium]